MKTGLFSTQRRRILLLAAVGVVAALFFLWPRGPEEPVYQGKTLTQWTEEADAATRDHPAPEARVALRAIGTNAIPFLLKEFTRPISGWRKRFNEWAYQHPAVKIQFRDDQEQIRIAAVGLSFLGSNAAPAMPVLLSFLDDPDRAYYAAATLYNIGDSAIIHLRVALASTNFVFRLRICSCTDERSP